MAANGTRSLVFIDDMTADRSSRMTFEVCRAKLSAQISAKCSKTNRMVLHSTDG